MRDVSTYPVATTQIVAAPGIGMSLEKQVGDQSSSACDRFIPPSGNDGLALLPIARLHGADLELVCGKRSR
jgi:hypothetical protein